MNEGPINVTPTKVVLDTNVLFSALWKNDSKPATIVKLISDGIIKPYFSDSIFSEYVNVLNRPKPNFSAQKRAELLSEIKNYGEFVNPQKSDVPMLHQADRKFYDVARAIDAVLVTGNTRHYPSEPFIMTPARFLEKLRDS